MSRKKIVDQRGGPKLLVVSPGKRGARSLAPVFGVDRRAIAEHDRSCLTSERRERVLEGLEGGGV